MSSINHAKPPANHLLDLVSGGTLGLLAVVTATSFGTVIFSGELTPALPLGIGLLLFSATVLSAIVMCFSSYPAMLGTVSESAIPVLTLVARQIVEQMPTAAFEDKVFTVTAMIVLNSVVSGLLFLTLGWFKLGAFVRFIPYPVVGGFLAGTGALLISGAMHSVEGLHLEHFALAEFFQPNVLLQLVPAIVFAIVMFAVPQRVDHILVLPGILAVSIALFFLILSVTGTSIAQAEAQHLLLGQINSDSLFQFASVSAIGHANWSVILQQVPKLAALWLVDSMALLLNANGIELAVERDLELNRELKVAGVATIVSGLGGGAGGYASSGENTLVHHLGGSRRLVGGVVSGLCLAMLLAGAGILELLPRFVLIGIPLLLGLEFFYEWLYRAWFKFSRSDYTIIVLITAVIAAVGYLPGIGVGLISAIVLFVIHYSQLTVAKRAGTGVYYHSNVMRPSDEQKVLEAEGEQIFILELQGLIFFGTATQLLNQIRTRIDHPHLRAVRFVVLDFRLVRDLDASAVLSFAKLKQVATKKQVHLLFTDLSSKAAERLKQGGCLEDDDPFCHQFDDLDRGLEWCEQQILQTHSLQVETRSLAEYLKEDFSDPAQVDRLISCLELRQIAEGAYLFHQGDPFDGLYFVGSGQVSVVLELGNEDTKRIRTYTVGNTIGEMGLYRKTIRMASVIADKPSLLYFLPAQKFEQIEATDPILALNIHRFIVNLLSERLFHREQELKNLLQSS